MHAGGVTSGMHYPGGAVGTLPGQGYLPVEGVEGDPLMDQVSQTVGTLVGERLHGPGIAEASPGLQGVLEV